MVDAVVIGSGPNGLVAANVLADAGWTVEVLEAEDAPGGAVKSAELIEPGFVNDVFSAFYPLAAATPALRRLELERFGLRWRHGPLAVAHPAADGTCPAVSRDLDETAALLGEDGEAWRELHRLFRQVRSPLMRGMTTPFPQVRAGLGLALALRRDLVGFARFALLPMRRLAEEHLRTPEAGRLLAGNALHVDLLPETAGSGFFGWLLAGLAQDVGFPFPEGGAGRLTDALVARLESQGGRVRCGARVTGIAVERGRAVGVRTASGDLRAGKAVLAAVDAISLYLELLPREAVPARVLDGIRRRFQLDPATFKLDWTLDGPIPWSAEPARRSPVVHVAESLDELSVTAGELARGLVPSTPFLVLGQYSMGDPTRMPGGKEVAWAYTHLPQGAAFDADELAGKMEERIEALAPGFRSLVRGRHALTPEGLEARDSNLRGGAIAAGSAQLHQQLVFRPIPGLGRPGTPVDRLYLASASAHPGGGVHGACGHIAATTALRRARLLG